MCTRYSWPTRKSRAADITPARCMWVGCGDRVRQSAIHTSTPSVKRSHVGGYLTEIYCIADGRPSSSKRRPSELVAVRLIDEARYGIAEAELGAKRSRVHDRPIEIRLLERISEAQLQFFQDRARAWSGTGPPVACDTGLSSSMP